MSVGGTTLNQVVWGHLCEAVTLNDKKASTLQSLGFLSFRAIIRTWPWSLRLCHSPPVTRPSSVLKTSPFSNCQLGSDPRRRIKHPLS